MFTSISTIFVKSLITAKEQEKSQKEKRTSFVILIFKVIDFLR